MHRTKTKSEVAAAWCETTTVHGVVDLYRAKQYSCCEFLFWLFVVLTACGLANWQIFGVIQSYADGNGYSTNIYFQRQQLIPYPNIVVCNLNRATQTAVNELNISSRALELFFGHFYAHSMFNLMQYAVKNETWLSYESEWNQFLSQNPSNMLYADRPDLLMDKLAHKCENMLLYRNNGLGKTGGLFGGPACCADIVPVKNTYGRCFSIKIEGNGAALAGPQYGLSLMAIVESNEYMSKVFYNNNFAQGILMFMTPNPNEPMPVEPILIRRGSHTTIGLSQKTYKFKQPSPFEIFPMPCVKNAQLKVLKGLYTADTCVLDCTITDIIQQCNCTPVNIEIQNSSQTETLRYCGYNKLCAYLAVMSDECANCMISCRVPCEDRIAYSTAVTTYDFPSNNSKYNFLDFMANSDVQLNITVDPADIVVVDIFYSQMDQMVVETVESTPIFSVVSNIGGQLGLWMGASMVSIVQGFHYFITMLRAQFHRPKVSVGT